MFFITFSNLWSFSYFFYFSYVTIVLSIIMYTIPSSSQQLKYSMSKVKDSSDILSGLDVYRIMFTSYLLLLSVGFIWSAPSSSVWFGHLVVTPFQVKMSIMSILYFMAISYVLSTTSYFSSREIYDYFISTLSFAYWVSLIFYSNSFFTALFIVEVLSSLSLLLITTSTFSTSFFYRNLNFNFGGFFSNVYTILFFTVDNIFFLNVNDSLN